MFYNADDAAGHQHQLQKTKQSYWLTALIYSAAGLIGLQIVGFVMMRSVVECVVRYSHADGACSMLFAHYAYQTLPGIGLVVADVSVFGLCIISLVLYLRARNRQS